MDLTDNELLDFDASNMPQYEAGDARRMLHDHGDVFRAQLVMARWIDGYVKRRQEPSAAIPVRSAREEGVDEGLRDIAAHARQGDFLPGGRLYEQEQERGTSSED